MAEQKFQAPSGMAGIVRYYDEDTSVIKLKPTHVIGMGIGLIILELIFFLMLPL